jgi:hypothetical protein
MVVLLANVIPPAPLIVVVPPAVEPIVTLVVEPEVVLLPIFTVWVLLLPATIPISISFVAVELPTVIPPVLFEVPIV